MNSTTTYSRDGDTSHQSAARNLDLSLEDDKAQLIRDKLKIKLKAKQRNSVMNSQLGNMLARKTINLMTQIGIKRKLTEKELEISNPSLRFLADPDIEDLVDLFNYGFNKPSSCFDDRYGVTQS